MDFIEYIEGIKTRLDPEQVLRFIAHEKCSPIIRGREVRDYCPVHKGSDQRSLAFNIDTKVGCCHSCGFKGDLIGLYQQAKGVSFQEATETLANHFESPIKYKENETRQMKKASLDEVWTRSTEKGNHRYLSHKKVDPCPGIRYGKDLIGNDSVVVPLYDVQGKMITAQFVHDKAKMFLAGHPAKGFFPIGTFKDGDTVYLAEGLATALTVWMALGKNKPVISFGSCGNMVDTVDALKLKYPDLKIIICLDDNKAAYDQAKKVKPQHGCTFLRPSFKLFSYTNKQDLADFNDIISKCGASLDVVRQQLTDNSNRVDPSKLAFEKELKHDDHSKKEDEPAAQAKGETNTQTATGLTADFEKDIIKYLVNTSFEKFIEDGFDPEDINADLFSGESYMQGKIKKSLHKLIVESYFNACSIDASVTISEIALGCETQRERAFAILNKIDGRSKLSQQQIKERIGVLRKEKAWQELKNNISDAEKNDIPFHQTVDNIRISLDKTQSNAQVIQSQNFYIAKDLEAIETNNQKCFPTGFSYVDQLLDGGLRKAQLINMSGGAGAGKTAWALQVADNIAASNVPIIYVSMEIARFQLTERSLKRLRHSTNQKDKGKLIQEYNKYCDNIFIVQGHLGMTVSEIRGMILSVMDKKGEDVVLFIDPFQRLSCGNKNVDETNETVKVNNLCSQLKRLANDLNIPIVILGDTTKDHASNLSGEGSTRGSYMVDHIADVNIKIRSSRDMYCALYGQYEKEIKPETKTKLDTEDPFREKILNKIKSLADSCKLDSDWDKYASLAVSKQRSGGKFNPLFIYRPAHHYFKEIPIWKGVLPENNKQP